MATAGQMFGDRGTTKVYFTTAAIASPAAPSIATDLGGGSSTDITDVIIDMPGFEESVSYENVPGLGQITDTKVAVSSQIGDPSLICQRLFNDDTIWDLFPDGAGGSIIICPEGNASGYPSEVWPVTVSKRQWDNTIGQAKRMIFNLTASPRTQGELAA